MRLIARLSSMIMISLLTSACGGAHRSDDAPTTSNSSKDPSISETVSLVVASTLDQGTPEFAAEPQRKLELQWDNAKSHRIAEGVLVNANLNADPSIKTYRLTELAVTGKNCDVAGKSDVKAFLEVQKPKSATTVITKPLILNASQGVDEKSYQYNVLVRVSNGGNCDSLSIKGILAYEDGSIIN